MRSLVILEVEHGETTDALESFITDTRKWADLAGVVEVIDYSVRVDLPACFVLD